MVKRFHYICLLILSPYKKVLQTILVSDCCLMPIQQYFSYKRFRYICILILSPYKKVWSNDFGIFVFSYYSHIKNGLCPCYENNKQSLGYIWYLFWSPHIISTKYSYVQLEQIINWVSYVLLEQIINWVSDMYNVLDVLCTFWFNFSNI